MFGFTINGNAVSFYGAIIVAIGTLVVLAGFLSLRLAPERSQTLGIVGGLAVGLGTVISFHSAFHTYAHENPCSAYATLGVLVVVLVVLAALTVPAFVKEWVNRDTNKNDGKGHGDKGTPNQGDSGRGFAGHEQGVRQEHEEQDEERDRGQGAGHEAHRASPDSLVVPASRHAWTYHGFGVVVFIVRRRRERGRFMRGA